MQHHLWPTVTHCEGGCLASRVGDLQSIIFTPSKETCCSVLQKHAEKCCRRFVFFQQDKRLNKHQSALLALVKLPREATSVHSLSVSSHKTPTPLNRVEVVCDGRTLEHHKSLRVSKRDLECGLSNPEELIEEMHECELWFMIQICESFLKTQSHCGRGTEEKSD